MKKCSWCGEASSNNSSLCLKHKEQVSKRNALVKCQRLSQNLCQYCGKRPFLEGLRYCQVCQQKYSVYHRSRNRELAEAGLCVCCGCRKQVKWTLCEKCADKVSFNMKAKFTRRKAAGLCVKCGVTPSFPFVRCQDCRDKMKVYNENYKARKST